MTPPKTVMFLRDIPFDDPQSEWDLAKEVLKDEGIDAEFIPERSDVMPFNPLDLRDQVPAPDIVLIDYGAMSIMGAHDGALSNVRYVLKWAEDHPSSAVIVWTQFTQFLVDEVYQQFAKDAPENVFIYQTGREKGWPAIRRWLGIEEPQ